MTAVPARHLKMKPLKEMTDEFVGPFASCDGDFDPDGDVDGDDLADYMDNPMGIGVGSFAANFGRDDCSF